MSKSVRCKCVFVSMDFSDDSDTDQFLDAFDAFYALGVDLEPGITRSRVLAGKEAHLELLRSRRESTMPLAA